MWNIRIVNLFVTLNPATTEQEALRLVEAELYGIKVYKLGERRNPAEIVISIVKDYGEETRPETLTTPEDFEKSTLRFIQELNRRKHIFDDVHLGYGRSD